MYRPQVVAVHQPPWRRAEVVCCVIFCVILTFGIGIAIGFFLFQYISGQGVESRPPPPYPRPPTNPPPTMPPLDISQRLNELINPQSILDTLRYMSSEPHLGGSRREEELAYWVKQKWEEYGADHVEINPYDVLLSEPDTSNPNRVTIRDNVGNEIFKTATSEKILSPDQASDEVILPFSAFSRAGDVEGQLVYVNYGRQSDFEELKSLGVDCTDKIVLAKYNKGYRGNKVYEAARNGAKGILLYVDPLGSVGDDPFDVFPRSTWLPGTGIRRGTISLPKGDQLTQGYPSKPYAYRTPMDKYKKEIQPPIPCQPISYDDAYQLLRRLGGNAAPAEWQGGLNVTYRLGPGFNGADSAHSVRIQVHNTEPIRTIKNVIGRIDGREEPDRYVLVGSHRDAWMFGSVDALSAQATMMEMVKAFGELKKSGWRPRRTLIFASWDAEEFGIIGSYEYVEEYKKVLKERAVAYLNTDIMLNGNFSFLGMASPVLRDVLRQATKKVPDPRIPTLSVYDTWRKIFNEKADYTGEPWVALPSSGSDHAPFIFIAGIPVTYHEMFREPRGGVTRYPMYHTVYETFQLIKLVDPHGIFLRTGSQVWAQLSLALLDSELLPLNVSRTASDIVSYTYGLKQLYASTLAYQGISFAHFDSAVSNLSQAADDFTRRLQYLDRSDHLAVRRANDKMMKLERMFLDEAGQPGRPVLKHVVGSPSSTNSYSSGAFGGIGDLLYEIDQADDPTDLWEDLKKHFATIIHCLQAGAAFLSEP